MPELPEVEVVCRQLRPHILKKKISKITASVPKIVGSNDAFTEVLIGDEFTELERIGKLMIFHLEKNKNQKMLGHLKMTGQFIYADKDGNLAGGGHSLTESDLDLPHKHTHVTFHFVEGSKLYFNDMRKFGYCKLVPNDEVEIIKSKYGIEPNTDNYTWESFARLFPNRKTSVKALLLNQQRISGLGNIYVDEACFRAQIHPATIASKIPTKKLKILFEACANVLQESIDAGGTTFYSFTDAQGNKGNYSDQLEVFARNGQPCCVCGTIIEKIKCAGRGTHFCPQCQKKN